MLTLCHSCGSTKSSPAAACKECGTTPASDDDLAQSFMLSDKVLTRDGLIKAARILRSGGTVDFPADQKEAVLRALRESKRKSSPKKNNGLGIKAWLAIALILGILFSIFHPLPQYHWAASRDRLATYEGFLRRFPSTEYTQEVEERIRILSEDDVWKRAKGSDSIYLLREYRVVYPDGKFLAEANVQITENCDERWREISSSATREEIHEFLDEFSETSKRIEANEQLVLVADSRWSEISHDSSRLEILRFLGDYPETSKGTEAKERIVELADTEWIRIRASRSEDEIRRFLTNYPETTKSSDAQSRIQELYGDWSWVKEQDNLASYRRFASRFPDHSESEWRDKRIIDLEVEEIAAGEYGEMPKAQALSFGGAAVKMEVENATGYVLTVRYSGTKSKKLVIPVGATKKVELPPGEYEVAASVTASSVTNYYGQETMRGGSYSSNFYIQTSYGGSSFSYPKRRR